MNIELLNKTLTVTEKPGLDTIDPRFIEIATSAQNGDYLAAASQAELIIEEGIYDIRIIGYFLYSIFLEQGAGGVKAIFQCLCNLLQENWEAIGPVHKKANHTQTSLNWFLKHLLKKLQYEEKKKSDCWISWLKDVSVDNIQETLDAGDKLQRILNMTLEEAAGPVMDTFVKVIAWLRAFLQVVYTESKSEEEEVTSEDEMVAIGGGDESETREFQDEKLEKAQKTPSTLVSDDTVQIEKSYHLKLLMEKMEAFGQLAMKEQFSKAAIVADDINNILADFDPQIYFPKLFAEFRKSYSMNIEALAEFNEMKETMEWLAMTEFYKVDIDGFIES